MANSTNVERITGVHDRELWRADDSDFSIHRLKDGTTVLGMADAGELLPGCTYKFFGHWEKHQKYGPQFRFLAFAQEKPVSRDEVVIFLKRYLPGIGEKRAHQIVDRFGAERAIDTIKNNPLGISDSIEGLAYSQAAKCAALLKKEQHLIEVKIHLVALLAGTGVHVDAVVTECLRKWGERACDVIYKDPFYLMRFCMPGCGFLRVDSIYQKLGLPLDATTRKVMAVWYVLRSDTSGSTWHTGSEVGRGLRQLLSTSSRVGEVVQAAVDEGWLTSRKMPDGTVWFADKDNAEHEKYLAKNIVVLAKGIWGMAP